MRELSPERAAGGCERGLTIARVTRHLRSSSALTLEEDWQNRIAGSVWYHDFRNDREVDNFRWTQNHGNDPNAVGSGGAPLVRRITSDGVTGGCLEIVRDATIGDGNFSYWHRPFSPIVGGTTTGNGRGAGQDDPGANGTITPKSYSPTNGGNQIATWPHGGWYGDASYHGEDDYDGTEYWLQCRVKIDPRRSQGINTDTQSGKLFYFTRNDKSLTDQEIVVESYRSGLDGANAFSMYRSGSPLLSDDPPGDDVQGNQPGSEYGNPAVSGGLCRLTSTGAGVASNCWHWPVDGTWTTILFHVKPGTATGPLGTENGNDGDNNTLIQVYAALHGETEYTCIWNQPDADLPFDVAHGHNALIASVYQNGNTLTEFWHRYCQMIFKSGSTPIPCPQVYA